MAQILLAIEAMSHVDEMAAATSRNGCTLRVLAERPEDYGSTAAEIVQFPTGDMEALMAYVAQYRAEIIQVISTTDTWGVTAAEIRDRFQFDPFIDTGKLKFFRDKAAVNSALINAGLASSAQHWPRMLKPKSGTGKVGVQFIASAEERDSFYEASGVTPSDYVEQPYHQGPMYSAEVWRDGTTAMLFGVTNRIVSPPPFFTEQVKSFPWAANTSWEASVENWVMELLAALDYDLGLAHVEFIETSSGFELVEINARMAGALITPGILATTNFNPYALAVEQALGVPLSLPAQRQVHGGISHVSVYADQVGTINAIGGIEELSAYPGGAEWLASRGPGSRITEVGTYRARVGNLVARGENACLAQDRAIAVARDIVVEVTTE